MDDKNKEKNSQETRKPRARRTKKSIAAQNTEKKEAANSGSDTKKQESQMQEQESASGEPKDYRESVLYLKRIGLKKVSNKTFINEADLAAFLEEDFTNINKTRALGFIQILEREYPVKLDELRKAYLAYYHENRSKEQKELFVQAKADQDEIWKKYVVWIIPILFLGGLVWYYLSGEKSGLSGLELENKVISTDINTDIVSEAEKNLTQYEQKAPESSPSEEEAQSVINSARAVPFKRGADNISRMNQTTNVTKQIATISVADSNHLKEASDDLDLDLMVQQMVKEYNLTISTDKNKTASQKVAEAAKTEEKLKPVKKNTAMTEAKKEQQKDRKKQKQKKTSKVKKETGKYGKLYIVPHKKSWVGVIYLDDYTKRDFLIRKTLKLNPNRPQLIVVGQKEFEIFSNGYSYRFRGKGPVRFIYKDGDIMEINNREFKAYSKGVTW